MKYITYDTATRYLAEWFKGKDELTLDELWKAVDRVDKDDEANNTWLTNKMTHLRHYKLVENILSGGRPNRRVGIKLTQQGKNAVATSRSEPLSENISPPKDDIDEIISEVQRLILILEEQLPSSLEPHFDIKLREMPMR